MSEKDNVVDMTGERLKRAGGRGSATKIWGESVMACRLVIVPQLILVYQVRLGLKPHDVGLLVQMLSFYWTPESRIYPAYKMLSERTGASHSTLNRFFRKMERLGYIRRITRRRDDGQQSSNQYDLTGLVHAVRGLAPLWREARAAAKAKMDATTHPGGAV